MAGHLLLFLDLGFEHKDFFAITLILFDQRQIPEKDGCQPGHKEKKDYRSAQFVPDTHVDVHCGQLYIRLWKREEKNEKWRVKHHSIPCGTVTPCRVSIINRTLYFSGRP